MPLTATAASWPAPLRTLRRRFRQERTAFVFSGGGNLGAVQTGMLRALVEQGIRPDLVVGCSVGAINGAAFADQPNLRGVLRLERIWQRLAEGDPDIMPNRGLLPMAVQLARRGLSLHTQDSLRQLLVDELGEIRFADLDLPFACNATDLDRATEVWFDEGDLIEALLASAALPGVFPPVTVGEQRCFDGGVVREIPIGRAVEMGATTIYLLHVGHLDRRDMDEARRPFDVVSHAYWTLRAARLDDELARIGEGIELIRLPAGSTPRLRFDDFSQGPELARLAHTASAHFLQTGELPVPVAGPDSVPVDGGERLEDEEDPDDLAR